MASLHLEIGGHLTLNKAILLYGNGSNSVATLHPVDRGVIQPGQSLTLESLNEVLDRLQNRKASLLPERVLFNEPGRLIWWTPAAKRTLLFKTESSALNQLSGQAFAGPALVFALGPGLRVFALEHSHHPIAATKLYMAPYYNLTSEGVCMGSMKRYPCEVSQIGKWEQSFWNSFFTHANGQQIIRFKGSYAAFLQSSRKRFNNEWLVPTELTLKDLI